jgi:hypothetical protein
MQLGLQLALDLIEPFEVHVEKPAAGAVSIIRYTVAARACTTCARR